MSIRPGVPQKAGVISLALRLESGHQYNNPDGAFAAQHQLDERSALWVALHYKLGLWTAQRTVANGHWGALELLGNTYRLAKERNVSVSRHALTSQQAYFAELLASTVTSDSPEDHVNAGVFKITFLL